VISKPFQGVFKSGDGLFLLSGIIRAFSEKEPLGVGKTVIFDGLDDGDGLVGFLRRVTSSCFGKSVFGR